MNVDLGAPYEAVLEKVISLGYAKTKAEALRQAIAFYEKRMEEAEEEHLLAKAMEREYKEIKSGKVKMHSLESVLAEAGKHGK